MDKSLCIDCDLVLVTSICNESLNELITSKKAVIEYNNLPDLFTDPIKLTQIFSNLISNGIIYNNSTLPIVTISCEQDDNGNWIIAVADNGIGIKQEYYDKVFELFIRLNDKRFYSGSGIGLAICKKTVAKIGGRIWIDKSDENGTIFKIIIPYTKT